MATIRAFYYHLKRFRDATLPNPAANLKPLAVTKTVVDTYDEVELEQFFQACTREEQAIFKTFYYTGLREQELAHLHWSDLNLTKANLTVRAKPGEGFIPKDWEEREIPLHSKLVSALHKLPTGTRASSFPPLKGMPTATSSAC